MSFRASLRREFSVHQKISPKLGCEGEFINCRYKSLWSGTSFLRYLKKGALQKEFMIYNLYSPFWEQLKIVYRNPCGAPFLKWFLNPVQNGQPVNFNWWSWRPLVCAALTIFFINFLKMRHHLIGVCTWDFWVTPPNPDFREMVAFFTALRNTYFGHKNVTTSSFTY